MNFIIRLSEQKKRVILAPCKKLKAEQRDFLNAIKRVYKFKTDTLKSAQFHTGKKWILKMDIKDFYGSVPYSDIECFIKSVCKHIPCTNINDYLNLITVDNKLPTGAPTSAYIANACFKPVKKEIREFCCYIWELDFSIYTDDLFFSSDNKKILNMVEKKVINILDNHGYKVNPTKTRYISDNKQQNILGLVVNNKEPSLPVDLKRKIRAMLHSYAMYISDKQDKELKYRAWDISELERLIGYISYIKHVDNKYYKALQVYAKKLA